MVKKEVNVEKLIDRFNDMHRDGKIITPPNYSQKETKFYMDSLICQIVGTIVREAEET